MDNGGSDEVGASMDDGGADEGSSDEADIGRNKRQMSTLCALCGTEEDDLPHVQQLDTLTAWCVQWAKLPVKHMTQLGARTHVMAARFLGTAERLASASNSGGPAVDLRAHRKCRQAVAHKKDLVAAKSRVGQKQEEPQASMAEPMDEEPDSVVWRDAVPQRRSCCDLRTSPRRCVVCNDDNRRGPLSRVEVEGTASALQEQAEKIFSAKDFVPPMFLEAAARIRAMPTDMHALDVVRHRSCETDFLSVDTEGAKSCAMHVDSVPDSDSALVHVCDWLRGQFAEGRASVKLAECERVYCTYTNAKVSRGFARKREVLLGLYNADMEEGCPDRVFVQHASGGPHQGYYLCTVRAAAACASLMHKQDMKFRDLEEFNEASDFMSVPELSEAQILHSAARILRGRITSVSRRVGGAPTPAGLGRAEAIQGAGGPDVVQFLRDVMRERVGSQEEENPGSDAEKRALSLAADLALAVHGGFQAKHLALAFVLRNMSGYEAANLLSSLGNCAPGRLGAEVRKRVGRKLQGSASSVGSLSYSYSSSH